MTYKTTVDLLEIIHKAKDLWIIAEGDKESMYDLLNKMDKLVSKYSIDSGFVGKMSKSDGEDE